MSQFPAGGIICVLWFGARLVVEDRLSPGELSTFVIYAVYVGSNVGVLAGVVSSLVQVCCTNSGIALWSPCFCCTCPHGFNISRSCISVFAMTARLLVNFCQTLLRLDHMQKLKRIFFPSMNQPSLSRQPDSDTATIWPHRFHSPCYLEPAVVHCRL